MASAPEALVGDPAISMFFNLTSNMLTPHHVPLRLSVQSRTCLWASREDPTRRAYFIELLTKSVATVAVGGAAPLLMPASPGYAYEEAGSRWLPEVNNDSSISTSELTPLPQTPIRPLCWVLSSTSECVMSSILSTPRHLIVRHAHQYCTLLQKNEPHKKLSQTITGK